MVQTKSFSLRVNGREESRTKEIIPGAGLWASILDRHAARRTAEEMQVEKSKERDAK